MGLALREKRALRRIGKAVGQATVLDAGVNAVPGVKLVKDGRELV